MFFGGAHFRMAGEQEESSDAVMADLMRHISLPVSVDFMSISYYGHQSAVRITKDLDLDLAGRHVLMVEDIVDTGMTLNYLLQYLSSKRPASLEVFALLDKRARRIADTPIKCPSPPVLRP
jgi:hypoxanthine phosphoribosyltransferase